MERDVSRLRNIGIIASLDVGNATSEECVLELTRPEAARHQQSTQATAPMGSSPARIVSWAPRTGPFVEEPTSVAIVERAHRVIDGALLVLDGARGAAETAEAPLREMFASRVPCVAFISEVGTAADLEIMADALESDLGVLAVPVHVPWNDAEGTHVIDVLEQRLVVDRDRGRQRELRPVPAAARDAVARARRRVVDLCAENDASIHGASSVGLDVGADELARALRKAAIARDSRVLVVTCGSLRARRNVGALLDVVVSYLPSPAERPPAFGLDPRRGVKVARFAREDDAFTAVVFASTEGSLGERISWLRIYSGKLQPGDVLVALPRDERAVVDRVFSPELAGDMAVEDAGPGAIVGVTGLARARPGDTLSSARRPAILDEARAPTSLRARSSPAVRA